MNTYFERHFLRPILDNNIGIVQRHMRDLTPTDLRELLAYYFNENSMPGVELVVEALPIGNYTKELLRLAESDTARGLRAFDRLLAKTTSDRSELYGRCIWNSAHAHCLEMLRNDYDPTRDLQINHNLWTHLFADNRMECWKDILMLSQHLPMDQFHGDTLDYMIDEMLTPNCLNLSDEEHGKALRAFIGGSRPDTHYDFVRNIISEYGKSCNPMLFAIIKEFPQTVDINHFFNTPLRWAVLNNCYDVFEFFYDLSTAEQRADMEEHLTPDIQQRWSAWDALMVKNRLETVVGNDRTKTTRKI